MFSPQLTCRSLQRLSGFCQCSDQVQGGVRSGLFLTDQDEEILTINHISLSVQSITSYIGMLHGFGKTFLGFRGSLVLCYSQIQGGRVVDLLILHLEVEEEGLPLCL